MTDQDQTDDRKYRAPALDKGLDILELLSDEPKGLTRAEIVKEMDRLPQVAGRVEHVQDFHARGLAQGRGGGVP